MSMQMTDYGTRIKELLDTEPVLLDEREALEARADDGHLEVVAAAGAVLDGDLVAGERLAEKRFNVSCRVHAPDIRAGPSG